MSWNENRMTDCHVRIEMPDRENYRTTKGKKKYLEREARELKNFLADHRSIDNYVVIIEEEYKVVCIFCDDECKYLGPPQCCDAAQVEYMAEKEYQAHCDNCKAPISHCECEKFVISDADAEEFLGVK